MKEESIVKFLNALGCKDASRSGDWVTCKCPLAPWTHKTGKDSMPSFGVHIENGGFNCFACQKGSLETLLNAIILYSSKPHTPPQLRDRFNIVLARQILYDVEGEYDVLPSYEEALKKDENEVFQPWAEWHLTPFLQAHLSIEASTYLTNRGVTMTDSMQFDLRWDDKRQMVVAPYRNMWGKLAGLRGRCVIKDAPLQHYDYKSGPGKNAGLVFYNEEAIVKAADAHMPVVLVEGQFDTIACSRHYPFIIGNLTAKPTWAKIATLNQCQDGVLLMLDNDKTGQDAVHEWLHKLRVPAGRVEYPLTYKDPDSMPGDVLQEVFAELCT